MGASVSDIPCNPSDHAAQSQQHASANGSASKSAVPEIEAIPKCVVTAPSESKEGESNAAQNDGDTKTKNHKEKNKNNAEQNRLAVPEKWTKVTTEQVKIRKAIGRKLVTLSDAHQIWWDEMRFCLLYNEKRADLMYGLLDRTEEIRQLVAFHCGLKLEQVTVSDIHIDGNRVWKHGSCNLCIPIYITDGGSLPSTIALRVPLPYKIGEEVSPGNCEEKLRCEAATYIWIRENCPDIPIPGLLGFGVKGGSSFCDPKSVPFFQRIAFYIRRFYHRLIERCLPGTELYTCNYVPRKREFLQEYNYLLVEWIQGENIRQFTDSLSSPHTEQQKENLLRGLSRIMLSLARVPQPRIGSWTLNTKGQLSLTNRPMQLGYAQLENWAIPLNIARNQTYTNSDTFYLDLLSVHDNRLEFHLNSGVEGEDFLRAQAEMLLQMRSLFHKYTNRALSHGPFVMQFTDLHEGNFMVDEAWNIKSLIDLEWTCSLPLGNLLIPYWIAGHSLDELEGAAYNEYKIAHDEFGKILEEEENCMNAPLYSKERLISRAGIMKAALNNGCFWYMHALSTPRMIFDVFRDHLEPRFTEPESSVVSEYPMSSFWTPKMGSFVKLKMAHHRQYLRDVTYTFHSPGSGEIQ